MQVYPDSVLNHKMRVDFEDEFGAVPFDPADRY